LETHAEYIASAAEWTRNGRHHGGVPDVFSSRTPDKFILVAIGLKGVYSDTTQLNSIRRRVVDTFTA